ncbi:hypothetical protein [Burkholderia sp. SIMBA_062]|uniref:hypothetical protein n=1 Tax=Burkholderia sp. SIMBA_062 TaxID=3085803 RepID=UPI00397D4FE4
MITSVRRFARNPRSQIGFQSVNRASTDAFNALEQWKSMSADRDYTITAETDDVLTAALSMVARDLSAGVDLDKQCERHGVSHDLVGQE